MRDKANSATKSSAISSAEEKVKSEAAEKDKNVSDDDKIRLQLVSQTISSKFHH